MNFRWVQLSVLAGIIFFCFLCPKAYAADQKEGKVLEKDFFTALEKIVGEEEIKAILEGEKIKEGGITNERTAYFIIKAEEVLYGTSYDKTLYKECIKKKRIFDYLKIKEEYKENVMKAYIKGIMVGNSRGKFTGSRTFLPRELVKRNECEAILNRLAKPKKRKGLSPDGQLLRTKNLPRNYREFPYILASFPNSYYESPYDFQAYIDPVEEGKHYEKPVNMRKIIITKIPNREISMGWAMDMYLDEWVKTVKNNMEARFNVDYRTIDRDKKWLNKLHSTYYFDEDPTDWHNIRTNKGMKDYIEMVKKNHIVIKGVVHLDKSSLYCSIGGLYLRTYVKFKVVSVDKMPEKLKDLFYTQLNVVSIGTLKKGVWVEKYFDIPVGSPNGYSLGEDFGISDDSLVDLSFCAGGL